MADLLFEIGTEELPSWYVEQGGAALPALLAERLASADLSATSLRSYASPRRLAVVASGLPERSPERLEERRGPPASVAYGPDGSPSKAALAFAASTGLTPDQLEVRETDKGAYLYAAVRKGGVAAKELLPELLAGVVRDLPAPRKMRWGSEPTPFIRPVAWLLALLGEEPLEVSVAGVSSGSTSRGHRFLHSADVTITNAATYPEQLRSAWVLVDRSERRAATEAAVRQAAGEDGLQISNLSDLLDEVTDLVEWPFAILGSFEESYLELPREVLATVMITHQRFFPTSAAGGELAAKFVGVANNRVTNTEVVRAGYEQVLAGRLYDARFFWRSDRRKSLSQHAWGLAGIAFQRELGSMADKVARVSEAVGMLLGALTVDGAEAAAVEEALPIFRADLATEMVYEFPELEGVMGRAYALAEGLAPATADALLGGVRPKSHDDGVPTTVAGAVLALADRTDKLVGFFALGKKPTGSADPFALRRDGLALVRVLASRGWPLPLTALVEAAAASYAELSVAVTTEVQASVVDFIWGRAAALMLEQGASVPLVRAAIGGSTTLIGAARRVELLKALMRHGDFADLMALYKRAANLARADKPPASSADGPVVSTGLSSGESKKPLKVKPELFVEAQEAPLYAALAPAEAAVHELLASTKEQLPGWDLRHAAPAELTGLDTAIAAVAAVKAPLDEFLDGVLVMAPEAPLRRNRLALLGEVVRTLRQLGALEQLEGSQGGQPN